MLYGVWPKPSRDNPRPYLAFMGGLSLLLAACGLWLITTGERGVGIFLIALPLVCAVVLRVAWAIGTKRGL